MINQEFIVKNKNNFGLLIIGVIVIAASLFIGSLWKENQLLKAGGSTQKTIVSNQGNNKAADLDELFQNQKNTQKNNLPEVTADDYVRGNKDATVTLVEYSDFECPFCQRFHPTMKQIMAEFDQEVAWVYRHYPLDFHANAQKAAEAAECVGSLAGPDAFWKFGDMYFERTESNGTGFPLSDLAALGAEVGANQNAVQKCLDSDEMAQKVKDQLKTGQEAGVSGTPGTFVVTQDGIQELLPGALPYAQIKQAIEKYL